MLLEALYEPAAVPVLATLKPADMRPGGARVPGTSYELEAPQATRVMRELLALRGASRGCAARGAGRGRHHGALRRARRQGAAAARGARIAYCTADIAAAGSRSAGAGAEAAVRRGRPAVHADADAAHRCAGASNGRSIRKRSMRHRCSSSSRAGCATRCERSRPRGLRAGAATLGVPLDAAQLAQFARLVAELVKWNKAYNLTRDHRSRRDPHAPPARFTRGAHADLGWHHRGRRGHWCRLSPACRWPS